MVASKKDIPTYVGTETCVRATVHVEEPEEEDLYGGEILVKVTYDGRDTYVHGGSKGLCELADLFAMMVPEVEAHEERMRPARERIKAARSRAFKEVVDCPPPTSESND